MSMLSSKKLEVVLVGLENSGKTTLLQVMQPVDSSLDGRLNPGGFC
jgi:predicted ATP-dependent endonuclease of OLD family